jgi:hypothetical protein
MLLSRSCRSRLVRHSDDIVNVHHYHAFSLQEEQETPQEQHPKPNQEESQDEYGQFDLNWDDPMVLAALNNTAER